jgi:alpha-glucosidase (family GH31 glycosyl hydrolase)
MRKYLDNFLSINSIAILLVLLLIGLAIDAFALAAATHNYYPVAHPAAMVISDDARFTILAPRVIRMEWAEDGVFEDHASLTFVNRKLPVPRFEKIEKEGWLYIKTKNLTLKYKVGSGSFNENNLQIEFLIDGAQKIWKPGTENKGNLFGTIRTLDGVNGATSLEPGLMSRDGWVLVDDSDNPLFDNSDWPWVMARRNKKLQDLYFFCYGTDYKGALKEYTQIAGKIALPPKFAFGTWWSRYWEFTDVELKELIEGFEIHDVPLDVLVIDMDWHITNRPEWFKEGKRLKDQAGQSYGWTGFTWNHDYFPDAKSFLQWTETKKLKVCMNLHPASGIQPHEKKYAEMAKAMGIDPATEKYVPFDIIDKKFAENFMKIILYPMKEDGVDFWWLDWQQWSTTKISGANPTFYLNYVFFSDMERENKTRPIIFHRYGGLGNHRYQIGFSGDTYVTWESLDFQPYFTATASNVCFGFWSHDVGGHYGGDYRNPELFTRWVQLATFSPIFRTHATKDHPDLERRIWAYPLENFYSMRNAYLLRYALIPYIYTAAREAYDTGVSLCRPLYYDYPAEENAYSFKTQYMFGNDMLVAPVTNPIEPGKLFTRKKIWLPEGEWIEWHSGTILDGGTVIERAYTLEDIPVFIKAGAIIPMQPKMSNTEEKPINPLILNIFPGRAGSARVYDDEGNNQNYKTDAYTFTEISFEKPSDTSMKVVIQPIKGSYPGMLDSRAYEVRLPITYPPTAVKVNGKSLKYNKDNRSAAWDYDGQELMTIIRTQEYSVHNRIEMEITFPDYDISLLSGNKNKISKLFKVAKILATFRWKEARYPLEKYKVLHFAQTGNRITLNPKSALAEIQALDNEWATILQVLEERAKTEERFQPLWELLRAID